MKFLIDYNYDMIGTEIIRCNEKINDLSNLDDNKALDINSLSLKGKSDIADYLIIATGTSSRHVSSLAEKTVDDLKKNNIKNVNTEGLDKGDWVLIDGGDIIIHLFREEVREFYDIEKLWSSSIKLNSTKI